MPIADAVLVVDDQRDAREMLSEYLAFSGFNVHSAQDGLEAIELAVRVRPRVILMDLMMPRLDGWEATRRLKSNDLTTKATIIAVSAHSQHDEQQLARQAGCDDFIPKPIDLERLASIVRGVLRQPPAPFTPPALRSRITDVS
jgi:two-component system, cell cycle response regulator DivK